MATTQLHDKLGIRALTEIPRMVGETDIRLIRAVAAHFPKNARLVEVGPGLGGVSIVLAGFGEVHVVDRFVWTEANAERYPGLAAPGDNFRPLYEELLRDYGADVTIHETTFQEFEWDGAEVDFCFIDGPRDAQNLLVCLAAMAPSLRPNAKVMIKNGLNAAYIDMMAFIHVLAALDIFRVVQTDQPHWCNIAVLEPGPELPRLTGLAVTDDLFTRCPLAPGIRDCRDGPSLVLARLAQRLLGDDMNGAFRMLDQLPPSIDQIYAWDKLEAMLVTPAELSGAVAAFSEVFAWHNDVAAHTAGHYTPGKSLTWALRAAWSNNADHPDRASIMQIGALAELAGYGGSHLADQLGEKLCRRRIVEIGTGLDASGTACIASGASSYFGIETGELTAAMMRAEGCFDAVTYMSLKTVDPDQVSPVDLIAVHAGARGEPGTDDLLKSLQKSSPGVSIVDLSP
jgi:hypothetical protein